MKLTADALSEFRKQVKLSTSNHSCDLHKLDLLHHRSFNYKEEPLPNAILVDGVKYQRIKQLPATSSFIANGSPSIITPDFIELIKEKVLPDFNKKYAIEQEIKNLTKQIIEDI